MTPLINAQLLDEERQSNNVKQKMTRKEVLELLEESVWAL